MIDPEILQSPLGIYEDAKNHKIIHNLYSFNGTTVKKTMKVDECKNFQKWFYDKIVFIDFTSFNEVVLSN